jgi:hypothetical protein
MIAQRANSNCLAGMQCPKCNSPEPFAIEVTTTFRVYDEGTDDQLGDTHWDEGSYCECCKCVFTGTVKDFTIPLSEGQKGVAA